MSLTYHTAILAPQTLSNDSPVNFVTKANGNWTLGKTELQGAIDAVQDALSTLFGEGLLSLPTVSYSGSSLSVTIGTCKVLIGEEIVYAGGAFVALANQTGASCYFCQDGTFANTVPTTKSYAVIGTYNSNGTGVTSFTLSGGCVLPKLVTVTGTVTVNVPDDVDYATGYVDHSASTVFAIDGKLKLTVSDTDAFTIEELYPGGMIDHDSNFANNPPHQRTDGGFWYKVTRKADYYYSTDPNVTITYTRTGLVTAT